MKIEVINIDGKKIENVEILDAIFSLKPNKKIIHSVLYYQMNLFKPMTAKK
jgi:ribosomal protein L4